MVTTTYTGNKVKPYADPDNAVTEAAAFAASKTIAAGTVVGQKTADGLFDAYDAGHSDGTEVARGIAVYDFTTDADGKVTIANEKGVQCDTAPIYIGGMFRTTELTGLDDDAVEQLGGLLTSGTAADGVLKF